MAAKRLKTEIDKILREEKNYAISLQERGEFGRAKLTFAAIEGVRSALRAAAVGEEEGFADRLLGALEEERSSYVGLWDDEDGVGTSTFSRVIDHVESGL